MLIKVFTSFFIFNVLFIPVVFAEPIPNNSLNLGSISNEKIMELSTNCMNNYAISCGIVGTLYELGTITGKPDYEKAEEFYLHGCNLGDPYSCVGLGMILKDGKTGNPDVASANKFFSKACKQQLEIGCLLKYNKF
jgi:TPR repeat protein